LPVSYSYSYTLGIQEGQHIQPIRKGEKQILIGLRVLGSSKWGYLSRQVSTLAGFRGKSELVTFFSVSGRELQRPLKITEKVYKILKVQHLMLAPEPIQPYYFQVDLIW
jgi:hypothetical protein